MAGTQCNLTPVWVYTSACHVERYKSGLGHDEGQELSLYDHASLSKMRRDAFHSSYGGAHIWSGADSKGVSERDRRSGAKDGVRLICADQ